MTYWGAGETLISGSIQVSGSRKKCSAESLMKMIRDAGYIKVKKVL